MIIESSYRAAALLASCMVLAVLGGCAAVDQRIGLSYTRPEYQLVRHSGDITVSRAASKPPARNDKGEWVIGSINNVHGVHQADLLVARNPDEWITEALLYELRQAGYSAAYADQLPLAPTRALSITNITVVLNENRGLVSTDTRHELTFNIEVYLNGEKAKTFTVASRDDRTIALSASGEELEKILLQSLQDAMRKVIPDIIKLIDQK
jgi:hypothetical protein